LFHESYLEYSSLMSFDNIVSIDTRLQAIRSRNCSLICGRNSRYFSILKHPGQLLSLVNLLFNWYWGKVVGILKWQLVSLVLIYTSNHLYLSILSLHCNL
jgi:hypothetical protein